MAPSENEFLHPYFLGAYAENDQVFENLLLEFFRDHAYWRRNFHPEDKPPIPTSAPYRDEYNDFLARMQQELHTLSADLKKSLPYFSPRYMGQMASDLLLPGLLAQMMTTFYNPNNVFDDTLPTTMTREIEVGYQIAAMFGMPTQSADQRHAWGHLTSGRTTSDYEGLWYLQTAKLFPISIARTLSEYGIELTGIGPKVKSLSAYSNWELFNFSLQNTVDLVRRTIAYLRENRTTLPLEDILKTLKSESLDQLGQFAFYRRNDDLEPPKVLVSQAASPTWRKAVNILGLGRDQLVHIPTDERMRLDIQALEDYLQQCYKSKTPILAVVGILGTLNFGSIDPIGELVRLRQAYLKRGFYFGLHIDATWAGYLSAMFRHPDGTMVERDNFASKLRYFPQPDTFTAFASLAQTDIITVDPQKLGYLPFPCGGFICSDGGVLDFFKPAWQILSTKPPTQHRLEDKITQSTKYFFEGSKPGSAAAGAYVTHRCLPLHRKGFGQLLMLTMRASEYFYDRLQAVKAELENFVHLAIPYVPDTNIICFAINPKGNQNLAILNHFSKKILKRLSFNQKLPLQAHQFFVSSTMLSKSHLTDKEVTRICNLLDVDPESFVHTVDNRQYQSSSLLLFRHSVMNPWLLFKDDSEEDNYIDRYFKYFIVSIKQELSKVIHKANA